MKFKRRPRWYALDNSAKIYPAARTRKWVNIYRLSATLTEDIEPDILQTALKNIKRRFPSICVKLNNGLFWYYVEEIENPPAVAPEGPHACRMMPFSEVKKCAFRVLYYKNRISTEFFHSLTDGNGALIFLKTLVATYLEIKYRIDIPHTDGVLDIGARAKSEELEDSFLKYSGNISATRRDTDAYILKGTPITEDFTPLITGVVDVAEIKSKAKEYNTTITTYLTAVMISALQEIQEDTPTPRILKKPVKVLVPVNLRSFYPSVTLRNFALYITPGIETRMGHYSFDEIIKSIHHQMGYELTEKNMNARMVTNVKDEKNILLRIVPLFIKNAVMKFVYNLSGERKSSITITNLGNVKLPDVMSRYVERFDFILTPQHLQPGSCSVISYNGKMYISFIRKIRESEVERNFFTRLVKAGIHVKIEANRR